MPPLHDKLILQAEDDENDVIFLKYVFKEAGIPNPLFSVADGQEVVDYLNATGAFGDRVAFPIPTLIFLDLKMPRMDGLDTLRWIRTHPVFRTLTVIMFTASASQQDINRAYELGANSFIIKPSGTDELTTLFKSIHAYWFGCNRFALPSTP
jgi:CheY-like chemotaxis protein